MPRYKFSHWYPWWTSVAGTDLGITQTGPTLKLSHRLFHSPLVDLSIFYTGTLFTPRALMSFNIFFRYKQLCAEFCTRHTLLAQQFPTFSFPLHALSTDWQTEAVTLTSAAFESPYRCLEVLTMQPSHSYIYQGHLWPRQRIRSNWDQNANRRTPCWERSASSFWLYCLMTPCLFSIRRLHFEISLSLRLIRWWMFFISLSSSHSVFWRTVSLQLVWVVFRITWLISFSILEKCSS